MTKLYVIADIHGFMDKLQRALKLIEADGGSNVPIVFLGDYIDRGPESAQVIDFLIAAKEQGLPWHMIKGNHDAYLEDFLNDGTLYSSRTRPDLSWLDPRLGGAATLASYGVYIPDGEPSALPVDSIRQEALSKVPQAHRAFLRSLPLVHETEELFFVHAGVDPKRPLSDQDALDLLWIRDGFLDYEGAFAKLIVHGHTAIDYPAHEGNRVNLDGGAGRGRALVPAVFEGINVWTLEEDGRHPLLAKR